MSVPHVLLATGGTGGRLFPLIAVAEAIRNRYPDWRLTVLASGSHLEERFLAGVPEEITTIRLAEPVRLRSWWQQLRMPGDIYKAKKLLRHEQIRVVVSAGGYGARPALYAAASLGIPLVLIEPNALPEQSIRRYAKGAALICSGFPQLADYIDGGCPIRFTGTPVRASFLRAMQANRRTAERAASATEAAGPNTGAPNTSGAAQAQETAASTKNNSNAPGSPDTLATQHTRGSTSTPTSAENERPEQAAGGKQLMVLGGTRGSRLLNGYMPTALAHVAKRLRGWSVLHHSGPRDHRATQARYDACGVDAQVVSVLELDDPAVLMQAADLVVSRAGGSTLAELAILSKACVLVPHNNPRENHERHNARMVADAGACRLVDPAETGMPFDRMLVATLAEALGDDDLRQELSANMGSRAKWYAAQNVANDIASLLQWAPAKPHPDGGEDTIESRVSGGKP